MTAACNECGEDLLNNEHCNACDGARYRFLREKFHGATLGDNTTWRCAFTCKTSHCIDAAIDVCIDE